MIWIILAVAAIVVFVFFEWRSRNTPLSAGLKDHWSAHSGAMNHDRPLTGGHDADRRH
jgi:hypothetical protein